MLRSGHFLRSFSTAVVRSVAVPFPARTIHAVRAPRAATLPLATAPRRWPSPLVRTYSSGAPLTKDEVEGRILSLLQGFDKVNDPANISPMAHFGKDLGLDSLDTVEVVMAIEEEFSIEIPDKDADTIHSVEQAVTYIVNQKDAH